MTNKEKITSKWMAKIMKALASYGLKDLSFLDSDGFYFLRDGFKIEVKFKLTKENGRRMIG